MTPCFVTGATGTVGYRVVEALRAAGAAVRAAARSPEKRAALQALGATAVDFDFTDARTMHAALTGVDRLFLLTPFVEHSPTR